LLIALNSFSQVTSEVDECVDGSTWKTLMYISARARPHDGSISYHGGAGLLHRGANGCTSIVFAGCSTQDHVSGRNTSAHRIVAPIEPLAGEPEVEI
jgi:hypothetical protein